MENGAAYERVRLLLNQKPGLRAHAMGIGGVGLAGVAILLRQRGWSVSGCDRHATGDQADALRRAGIPVAEGHVPGHLDAGCNLLIHSAAVADDDPEIRRAQSLGIPIARRGVVLAALVSGGAGVAVCGTHGKTTTACFTLRLLQALGADPAWCIGGRTAAMGRVADGSGRGRRTRTVRRPRSATRVVRPSGSQRVARKSGCSGAEGVRRPRGFGSGGPVLVRSGPRGTRSVAPGARMRRTTVPP